MYKITLILLFLLICSQAEIIHRTTMVSREEALDIDKGETFERSLGFGDLSTAEFIYHGEGLEWIYPDSRNYSFLRQSFLCTAPLSELTKELDLSDTSLFCKGNDKTPMFPIDSGKYDGGDTSGITMTTLQDSLHLGVEDIATNQIFIMKTNEGNYALARIKEFYRSYKGPVYKEDVDSLLIESWLQSDGSTDFSALSPAYPSPTDFQARHFYDMPTNGYSFQWNLIEHDSLVGYQIYVDSFPLMRTTDTSIARAYEIMEDSLVVHGAGEQYFWNNRNAIFYVKALYGTKEEESIESDKLFREIPWATSVTQTLSQTQQKPFVQKNSTIQFSQKITGTATLLNLQGKELLKREIQSGTILNLEQLPSQYYILSVESQQGIKQYQILKQ